jgi:hypothetical protein
MDQAVKIIGHGLLEGGANVFEAMAIKVEIDKLRQAKFNFPIEYTSWVSNLTPVTKKQGTVHVCMNLQDLNKACPKDNFPTPFINKIVDSCASHEVLSLMDNFSGYNQI